MKIKRKGYPSGDLLKKINKHTAPVESQKCYFWMVRPCLEFTKGKHIKIDTICESGSYPSGAIIENTIGGDLITHTILASRIESGSIVSGNIISGCLCDGFLLIRFLLIGVLTYPAVLTYQVLTYRVRSYRDVWNREQ